jgi:uncharacterized protein YneF (UPF0154 family)
MFYRLSADLVLIVHLAFVVFVVLGGFLVLRWPRIMWMHLLALAWGAAVEFSGIVCPLTPLEGLLRELGGESAYEGDFIGHYITAFLYPAGLTRELQVLLGFLALLPNVAIYGYWIVRRRRTTKRE